MKVVALVPMRSGSKSIPGKNIKFIAGYPLFYWSISAAVNSAVFDSVYVSTDSDEYIKLIQQYFGEKVQCLKRDPSLAQDQISTEAVMLDFSAKVEFDVLCTIQVTSPLTQSSDFVQAYDYFKSSALDSLVTATKNKRFFWQQDSLTSANALNYNPLSRPRRQDFDGCYMENGAFYFSTKTILENTGSRLGGKIGLYPMASETELEIDEPLDWEIASSLLMKRQRKSSASHSIQAVVVDVDGTLTDGGMYYTDQGDAMRKFNTRDGAGLHALMNAGIRVVIMTGEDSPAVAKRMEKLGINYYFPGVKNKLEKMTQLLAQWHLNFSQVAYIGDDVNDVEAQAQCVLRGCPANAVKEIGTQSNFISRFKGGEGCVREFAEYILESVHK